MNWYKTARVIKEAVGPEPSKDPSPDSGTKANIQAVSQKLFANLTQIAQTRMNQMFWISFDVVINQTPILVESYLQNPTSDNLNKLSTNIALDMEIRFVITTVKNYFNIPVNDKNLYDSLLTNINDRNQQSIQKNLMVFFKNIGTPIDPNAIAAFSQAISQFRGSQRNTMISFVRQFINKDIRPGLIPDSISSKYQLLQKYDLPDDIVKKVGRDNVVSVYKIYNQLTSQPLREEFMNFIRTITK